MAGGRASDDATDLAAAIRGGETTASAAMEASLARAGACAGLGAIRRLDPVLGRDGARAFDEAFARRSRRAREAPLGGVPFLMKDLGAAARGLAPVAGSPALAARTADPTTDDDLVRRFRRLGLVPFGLTTTPEFGLALTSEPPTGPAARNPFDASLSPGGSSGGAAAAVAAGIVAIAHATDAAGSIRVPAAACGLFGLKPTRGAIPGGPSHGNHLMGIAGELVVARSARDVATVLATAAGDAAGPVPDPDLDAVDAGATGLRIAVVDAARDLAVVDPAELRVLERAAGVLDDLGHRVERVSADRLTDLTRRSAAVARTVLSVALAALLDGTGVGDDEVSPLAAAVRREGRRTTGAAVFAATQTAATLAHTLWRTFERHDVILTPMLAAGPPRVGSMPSDHADTDLHFRRMIEAAPFAPLPNVGGVPAISAPFDAVAGGRPGAVQLIGPMGADRLLLSLAASLAAARPAPLPWTVAGMPGGAP